MKVWLLCVGVQVACFGVLGTSAEATSEPLSDRRKGGDTWDDLLVRAQTARGEDEVLSAARIILEIKSNAPVQRDKALLELVNRLEGFHSRDAREILHRIAEEEPQHLMAVPGCREPIFVPVHPFDTAATLALSHIEMRLLRGRFAKRLAQGEVAWARDVQDEESLEAAMGLIEKMTAEQRRETLALLAAQGEERGRAHDFLRVELWLDLDEVPSAEEMRNLHADAAVRFVVSVKRMSEEQREELLAVAQANPHSRSAAKIARTARGRSTREVLQEGAEGALLLSRDLTTERLSDLTALLMEASSDREEKRLATLTLMLADADEARRILQLAVNAGQVPARWSSEAQ